MWAGRVCWLHASAVSIPACGKALHALYWRRAHTHICRLLAHQEDTDESGHQLGTGGTSEGGVGVGGLRWCGVSYLLLCSGEEQQMSTDTAAGLQPKSLKCDE